LYIFHQSVIKFGTENVRKILTNYNTFCENQCVETHTLLVDVNEFLCVLSIFVGILGAVQCKKWENAVKCSWVSWKL